MNTSDRVFFRIAIRGCFVKKHKIFGAESVNMHKIFRICLRSDNYGGTEW